MENLVEIVKKAKAGDDASIGSLYELFQKKGIMLAYKYVKSESTAEDMYQDSFIKAMEHLDSFDENKEFGPWINTIIANTCKNYLEKKKSTNFGDMSDEELEFIDTLQNSDEDTMPEQVFDRNEITRIMDEILSELPDAQRQAVTLFYYQEKTVKEIAQLQEVPEDTVKSRLNYSRKKVGAAIEDYQKKKGIRLYSVTVVPVFFYMYFKCGISAQAAGAVVGASASTSIATAAAKTGAENTAIDVTTTASTAVTSTATGAETATTATGVASTVASTATTGAASTVSSISTAKIAIIVAAISVTGAGIGGAFVGYNQSTQNQEMEQEYNDAQQVEVISVVEEDQVIPETVINEGSEEVIASVIDKEVIEDEKRSKVEVDEDIIDIYATIYGGFIYDYINTVRSEGGVVFTDDTSRMIWRQMYYLSTYDYAFKSAKEEMDDYENYYISEEWMGKLGKVFYPELEELPMDDFITDLAFEYERDKHDFHIYYFEVGYPGYVEDMKLQMNDDETEIYIIYNLVSEDGDLFVRCGLTLTANDDKESADRGWKYKVIKKGVFKYENENINRIVQENAIFEYLMDPEKGYYD